MKWMLQILTLPYYRCGCPWFKKCGSNEDESVVTVGMKKEKEEESEEEDK